jgi:hypothetical protein
MAIIKKLEPIETENSPHTEVRATYSIITDKDGGKFLQIDSYGSISRKIQGKKSQSMRFTREAIEELRKIISDNKL